jgi:PilZ domain
MCLVMRNLLGSVFNRPCKHEFTWPNRRSEGGYYQVCARCGEQYVYDWATMCRRERILTSVCQTQTGAPELRQHIPRAQRLTVRKPIFYRQVGQSQYHLAMLENISESGILLECHSQIPEGTNLEMIFEMPEEITGQPNTTVLCRGEVVRSTLAESSMLLVGVAISGCSIAGA